MNNTRKFTVRDIVYVGMLAAFCTISTTIKIPYGNGAMVHLGTAALYTIAILFGGTYAGLSGAIGTAFFDLMMGFSPYTLWSFFIKGIAGFIVGKTAHSGSAGGEKWARNLFACMLGAAWTLLGYLAAWTVVIGNLPAAMTNIPSSLVTSGVGMLVAIPLSATLRFSLSKAGLLKQQG